MKKVSLTLVVLSVLFALFAGSCRKRVYCDQCWFRNNAQDSAIYIAKECFDHQSETEARIQQLTDSFAVQGYTAECNVLILKQVK
ncbi:MAG: hypothetical protein IBJ09_01755 [Bacteroidia bacterium]|nr:hypothetical protein [Bacteroidia bacterium]